MKNKLIKLNNEIQIRENQLINEKNGLICTIESNRVKNLLRDLKYKKRYSYYESKYGTTLKRVINELITQGFIQVDGYSVEQTTNGLCMVIPTLNRFYQLKERNLYYDVSQNLKDDSKYIGLIGITGFSNSYYHNISFESVNQVRKATMEIANLNKKDFIGKYKGINRLQLVDYGDLDYTISQSVMEKWLCDIGILLRNKNIFPIYIGGDHTVTYFLLKKYIRSNPVQIIQIDAHKDMGYQRGSKIEHGSVMRKIIKNNNVKKIIQLGIRGPIETYENSSSRIVQCNINDIKKNIIEGIPIYLTIDSDGFDPTLNPAVNYPIFGGITLEMFSDICKIISQFNLIGVDVVEYNSENDTINKLGAHFIGQIILELLKNLGEKYEN